MISRRLLVEHSIAIDVRILLRRGGPIGAIWIHGMRIGYVLDLDARRLAVALEGEAPEWISLTSTEPHFGGSRSWMLCPGCEERIAIVYRRGAGFRCRRCLGPAYRSTRQRPFARSAWRARKIRQRLDGAPSLIAPFPSRPR